MRRGYCLNIIDLSGARCAENPRYRHPEKGSGDRQKVRLYIFSCSNVPWIVSHLSDRAMPDEWTLVGVLAERPRFDSQRTGLGGGNLRRITPAQSVPPQAQRRHTRQHPVVFHPGLGGKSLASGHPIARSRGSRFGSMAACRSIVRKESRGMGRRGKVHVRAL